MVMWVCQRGVAKMAYCVRCTVEREDRSSEVTMVEYVYLDRRYYFVTSGARLVMMVG